MRKIFVTGGTGFLGKRIVQELQKKGNEIYVLTRKDKVGFGQVHFIKGDIADADLLKKTMNVIKPDILVRLAWNAKDGFYASSDENRNWV